MHVPTNHGSSASAPHSGGSMLSSSAPVDREIALKTAAMTGNATQPRSTLPTQPAQRAMAIAVVCDDNPFAINGRQHQQRVCPHTLDCRSRQPSSSCCTFPPFVHQRASATMVTRVLPCQYHQWYTCTTVVLEYHGRVSGWAVPPVVQYRCVGKQPPPSWTSSHRTVWP
jgi:hypothetical protein